MKTITRQQGKYIVTDNASLNDVIANEPYFFRPNSRGGRETNEMYKGFLITRETRMFDRNKTRCMSVRAFGFWEEEPREARLGVPLEVWHDTPIKKAYAFIEEILKESEPTTD